jgi:streptomycin 6-kinase
MKAISIYDGRHICKCYDYDIELGAMFLERVTPGRQFKELSDSDERINIGSNVISRLPIFIEDTGEFHTYAKWVGKAFKRARKENKVGEKMLYYIDEAEILFKEIEASDKRKLLLHGDLHHENILQDKDASWTAIDPKGVIGPLSMEAARFIQNEFRFVASEDRLSSLDKMATIFSEKLVTSKRMIAAGAFVLMVLSICWCFEEYSQSEEVYEEIKDCQLYLDYVQGV